MNGMRNWILLTPHTLQDVNLVKHPRNRRDLGRLKVEIQSEWILDRNPEAKVTLRPEDVFQSTNIHEDLFSPAICFSAVWTRAVRLFLNSLAIRYHQKPCITASGFSVRDLAGKFTHTSGYSGCFECMDKVATQMGAEHQSGN